MMGTINCVYETPCGWCSKWDKKCDKKIPECESNKKDDNSKWLSQAQIDTAFAERRR